MVANEGQFGDDGDLGCAVRSTVALFLLLSACKPEEDAPPADPFPAADAWGPTTGPGGPTRTFTEAELFTSCGWLQGDAAHESDHHNLVVMYDGYLVMPWAPEDGPFRMPRTEGAPLPSPFAPGEEPLPDGIYGGGITLYDISDPCSPVKVGEAWSPWMRETHAMGFETVDGCDYMAVDYLDLDGTGGVGFWDITDRAAPFWASQVAVPNHKYPDSYTRLTLSNFWQGRYVYAPTSVLGVAVVDAADPLHPTIAGNILFDGPMTVGMFHMWGNRAMASSAGVSRVVLLDTSDPLVPQPILGGDFNTYDSAGALTAFYFSNVGVNYGLFARSTRGGGPVVYDLTNMSPPTFVSNVTTEGGDGGYIFQHNDFLFQGDSNFGSVYDFADPTAPTEIGRIFMKGDLDTVTPLGNVAFVSVDEKGNPGQATGVFPWSTELDTTAPMAGMTSPEDGAKGQALTSRVGVVFDEMIEPRSAFTGSFRVADPDGQPVPGVYNVQENIVNFSPDEPLLPGSKYTVTLKAGGLVDYSGNALAADVSFSFTTVGSAPVTETP